MSDGYTTSEEHKMGQESEGVAEVGGGCNFTGGPKDI